MSNALDRMLQRLTDAYNKDSNSNVGKLLAIASAEVDQLRGTAERVGAWHDIDHAEGSTLDRIGYDVQQYRGQATDPVYRILIKSKIARNLSDGSTNTLIRVLAITLDTDVSGVIVRPLWGDAEPEPAAVFVSVPAQRLNEVGLSFTQFGRLVNKIVAAAVRAQVLFQGTFQLSSQVAESEFDPGRGLADLEQTFGGTLGAVYDPAHDPDLPL